MKTNSRAAARAMPPWGGAGGGAGGFTCVAMLTVVMPLPVPVPSLGIYPSTGLTLSMHPAKKKKTGTQHFQQTHKYDVWCHMGVQSCSHGITTTDPNVQGDDVTSDGHGKPYMLCVDASCTMTIFRV